MITLTNDSRNVIRRVYEEMWNKGDPSAARGIFSQPEGVERFVREFLSAFPDLQHTVESIIVEGDQAAARFTARGTHTGRWEDFGATGRAVRYTGVTVARIAGGKIVEHHTWWDREALIQQMRA